MIWFNRNLVVHDNMCSLPSALCKKAGAFCEEFSSVSPSKQVQVVHNAIPTAWMPLPQGLLKLNSDASYVIDVGVVKYGFVVRNYKGEVVLSSCFCFRNVKSTLHTELMVLCLALEIVAKELM